MALNLIDKVKSLKNLNPELPAIQFAKKAAKYLSLGTAAAFAAALAFFAHLGAVALKGFIIGATIGGTGGAIGGAIIGAQIGAVLIPIPIVGPLIGAGVGAVIGGLGGATLLGIAGGLIALAIDQGSLSLGAAGVGAGGGTIVGAYIGASVGGAVGVTVATAFISFAVAACTTTLIGCLLVPVATLSAPLIVATFTAAGAIIGAGIGFVIGGVGGYLIGKYILEPTWSYIEGAPNAISSTVSGGLAGFGHMVTGLASSAFNLTVVGWGGSLLNGAVGLSSYVLGSLTGTTGALAGQIAAVAVGTTIASAATLAILNAGILTPGKFATTQTDKNQNIIPPPGSAYLTVTKTATPSTLQNSDLPKTINFEVIVSSKSVKLTNVTCEDLTTLVKSDGSTVPLTITPTPSCPSTIDANSQVKFNFTTQAENTSAFQNASIVNVFNVYYDIEQLALGSCSTGSGFGNLLPNPPPASAGAVSPSLFPTLDSGQVVPAAVYGATKSGVACELLVGLDYVEASWYDDGSFISGRKIGVDIEPDVTSAADCTAYGGTWTSGCTFSNLQDTAYYAGDLIKVKMSYLGYGVRPPASFNEMVGAMSYYNGGGNHNCGRSVPYTGPCPPPTGIDDSYVMTHFDTSHATMYLIYCSQYTDDSGVVHGIPCDPPRLFDRDGTATAAKEYYLRGAGPY